MSSQLAKEPRRLAFEAGLRNCESLVRDFAFPQFHSAFTPNPSYVARGFLLTITNAEVASGPPPELNDTI